MLNVPSSLVAAPHPPWAISWVFSSRVPSVHGTLRAQGCPAALASQGLQPEPTKPQSRGGGFPGWVRMCFGDILCQHMFHFLWRGERICQLRLILETGKDFFRKRIPPPLPGDSSSAWGTLVPVSTAAVRAGFQCILVLDLILIFFFECLPSCSSAQAAGYPPSPCSPAFGSPVPMHGSGGAPGCPLPSCPWPGSSRTQQQCRASSSVPAPGGLLCILPPGAVQPLWEVSWPLQPPLQGVCEVGEGFAEPAPARCPCAGTPSGRFQSWSASAGAPAARAEPARSTGEVVLCPVPQLAAVAEGKIRVFPQLLLTFFFPL